MNDILFLRNLRRTNHEIIYYNHLKLRIRKNNYKIIYYNHSKIHL